MHIPNVVQIVGSIWVHRDQVGTYKNMETIKIQFLLLMRRKACDCIDASGRLRKRKGEKYPVGRLSTKLISILSLLPPSEARPACISTIMASATCLSLPMGVAHFSSNSLTIAIAVAHLAESRMRRRTTNAAAAQTVAAQMTAAPTATFPIATDYAPKSHHGKQIKKERPQKSPRENSNHWAKRLGACGWTFYCKSFGWIGERDREQVFCQEEDEDL